MWYVFSVGGSKTSEDRDGRIWVEAWTLEFADDTSVLTVANDESELQITVHHMMEKFKHYLLFKIKSVRSLVNHGHALR